MQQKTYYDKSAKTLETLKANQIVRMQTVKGYDRIGVVKQVAKQPRSYIVESNRKEYRRNRRHLLAVPEPYHHIKEEINDEPDLSIPFESSPQSISNSPTVNTVPDETYAVPQQAALASIPTPISLPGQVVTRSGRVSKPNTDDAHRRAVSANDANQPVARHFNSGSHCISDMKIRALCPISGSNDSRKTQEMRLISKLGTVHHLGINERFSFI